MRLVCALVAAICLLQVAASFSYEEFLQRYGKRNETEDHSMHRERNFRIDFSFIRKHNRKPSMSFIMGINNFTDMWDHEMRLYTAVQLDNRSRLKDFSEKMIGECWPETRPEVDWRLSGRVTGVKSQGKCMADWAFAITGAIEGQQQWRNDFLMKPQPVSEEMLINKCLGEYSCSSKINLGHVLHRLESCKAYDIASSPIGGAKPEESADAVYPTVLSRALFLPKSERWIERVVANFGPVVATMVVPKHFFFYKEGVYTGEECKEMDEGRSCSYWESDTGTTKWCSPVRKNKELHAVLIVGYGTDAKHGDYWIIKNSWSDDWGELGYARIKRGENACHIADEVAVLMPHDRPTCGNYSPTVRPTRKRKVKVL